MFRSLLCLLIPILIITSCKKKDTSVDVSDFEQKEITTTYLDGVTRGMLRENGVVRFMLKKGVLVDVNNFSNAIAIKPDIAHTVSYNQERRSIEVKPTGNFERGKEYEIFLDLDKLDASNTDVLLSTKIKIFDQFISVNRKGLIIQKDGKKFIEINANLALEESRSDIKRIFDYDPNKISVKEHKGQNYTIWMEYEEGVNNISWDGSPLQSKEKGAIKFWGSDFDGFNVISTYHDRGENTFNVYFSRLINQEQDKDGLILQGLENAQYDIENNMIKIFLNSKTQEFQKLFVKAGLLSQDDIRLEMDYEYDVSINILRPRIRWMENKGIYIPRNGEFKVPFTAVGLKKVRVKVIAIDKERAAQFTAWNDIGTESTEEMIRYGNLVHEDVITLDEQNAINLEVENEFGLDLSDAFARNNGFIYRIFLDFLPSYTILTCEDKNLKRYEREYINNELFDRQYHRYYYDDYYNYNESGNPCKTSYYVDYNNVIDRTVHCTNVFPIIKKSKDQVVVAITELMTEKSAHGAEVSLLTLQGYDYQTKNAGTSGIVKFERPKRDAKAVKIAYNGVTSYFSLTGGEQNSITEFNVSSGAQDIDNRLFVYEERDVRRPGDTIYLNVMLGRANFYYEPGLPIKVSLYNPKNVMVDEHIQHVDDSNIYTFKFPTDLEAPTGYWKAKVKVGPYTKTHSLRVETIKPNVVDVVYKFDEQNDRWIYGDQPRGVADIQYLMGYAMKKGALTARANVYPLSTPFEDFKSYTFIPFGVSSAQDKTLFSAKTNDAGIANIQSEINFKKYKGVSKLRIDSKVDLPGGGLNTETESFFVSPYDSYVGIEKVKGRGYKGSFQYGERPKIRLVNVDEKGERMKGKTTATMTLYKCKKDWWYDRYRLSRDQRVNMSTYYEKVKTDKIVFNNGEGLYEHDINKLTSGMYHIVITDDQSGHRSEYKFHSVTIRNYNVKRNPLFIDLALDKDNYEAGDRMKVKLPQMEDAVALISIEKGTKVLESFWMDLNNPDLELEVKNEWFPNFYLDVVIVQNYDQQNNNRPMRMYTVEKILVNSRNQILEPQIIAKKKVQPQETFTIEVKEKNDLPMDYTLAVVDFGLLNLTGFSTPDPLAHFSKQFSLLISTWDIYNRLILPGHPSFAGVFSIGGDGALKKLDESADFSRFEPVVYHLGPFHLNSGGIGNHAITLPNYIGNLKVTVVAANDNTYGNAEEDIKVASPLMLQSQLPRALNVSDEVVVPITVFKDEKSIRNVDVSASSDGAIIFNKKSTAVNLSDEDQELANLKFKVGDQAGKTHLEIAASSGQYKFNEETDIFINYPNGYSEESTYMTVESMDQLEVDVNSFGYEKTKHVDITLSGIILPAFSNYYHSLIHYPYGCLEQTTSKGFAMLYIDDLIEMSGSQKLKNKDFLDAALTKISSYQSSSGAYNYWRNGYYHAFADIYAGHFMVEAKEKGLLMNQSSLNGWMKNAEREANRWNITGMTQRGVQKLEEFIQAYRLYVLAKANNPATSAMNRLYNQGIENPMAKMLLGGAYYLRGMEEQGENLFFEGLEAYNYRGYSYGTFNSDTRNKGLILSILAQMEHSDRVDRFYNDFVKNVNKDRYLSTQEKGFVLMGCYYYLRVFDDKGNRELDYEINSTLHNKREKLKNNASASFQWNPEQITDDAVIMNKAAGKLYVTKTERAISKNLKTAAANNVLDMSVSYRDLNGKTINHADLKQGTEFTITVKIHNTDINDQEGLALALRMPSGWELINPRMYTTASNGDEFTYQDFRDDKVYTFFDIGDKAYARYSFRVKAILKGSFHMPPITVENMYRGEVNANTASERVVVN